MRRSTPAWAAILTLVTSTAALAQPEAKPTRAETATSADPRAEIERLRKEGGPKSATAVAEKVAAGLPAPALDVAVVALTEIGGPVAIRALEGLARHRRPAVRRAALEGLVKLKARNAGTMAEAMLDDASPEVRVAAVRALEGLGVDAIRRAAPPLEKAVEKGLAEAAPLLGKAARRAEIGRWTSRLDEEGFERLDPALRIVVARADLPGAVRAALVERVGSLQSASAKQFLRDLAAKLPKGDPVRAAAQKALEASTAEAADEPASAPGVAATSKEVSR